MDMHNLQQLWISIIALWVDMLNLLDYGYQYVQLWQSIMATHDTIMDIHKDNSNLDIKTLLWISNIIKWPMPLGARPRSIKNVNKIL